MEKKNWVKPVINAVEFAANEYVSACRQEGTNEQLFKFVCDAERGALFFDYDNDGQLSLNSSAWLWGREDENGHWTAVNNGTYGSDSSKYIWFTSGDCGAGHETTKAEDFTNGFIVSHDYTGYNVKNYTDVNGNSVQSDGIHFLSIDAVITKVIAWTGYNGDEHHATTNLQIDSWEAAFS